MWKSLWNCYKTDWGIWVTSPATPPLPLGAQHSAAGTITSSPKCDGEAPSHGSASSHTVQESDLHPSLALYSDIQVIYIL